MLVLTTAFLLGIVHAFGADHLAAVSAFVSQHRRMGAALMVSIRWGSAHMMSVLVLGSLISVFSGHLPARFEPMAESAVGLVLVLVGLASLRRNFRARKLHFHTHHHDSLVHSHFHSHFERGDHSHNHAVTLTGFVHGLAGTLPALVLFPLATLKSPWAVGICLLVFGLGVILGMAGYCLALSSFLRTLSESSLYRWAQPVLGGSSCILGIIWIVRTHLIALH